MRSEYDFSKMKKSKKKSWSKPRNLSLVRFILSEKFGGFYEKAYPFKAGTNYLFVGEIPNMTGHCVIMDVSANVGRPLLYIGYHTDNFEELTKEEV